MRPLAARLSASGFAPTAVTQRNFNRSVDQLADDLQREVERCRGLVGAAGQPLHFVTHSFGGIVLRRMLSTRHIDGLGRAVLLTPPNQGSRFVAYIHDRVLRLPWGEFDPLEKVLPGVDRPCRTAGQPAIELGILAGAPPEAPRFPWVLRPKDEEGVTIPAATGKHDGTLALDECALASAKELLVLPYGHTFFMSQPEVATLCARFLATGSFESGSH